MKNNNLFFQLFLLLNCFFVAAQDSSDKIIVTADHYKILGIKSKYLQSLDDRAFSNELLNQFFAAEITSFTTTIKDQSIEKYFINANTDNKSLAIGRSIDFRELFLKKEKRKLHKMNDILTMYIQSGLDKNFSNIYEKDNSSKDYQWSNDLGAGIRLTHFFNGLIRYKTAKKEKIRRVNIKIIDDYLKQNVGTLYDAGSTIKENLEFLKTIEESEDYQEKKDKYLDKKYYETYIGILDKQIEKIKSEKLYTFYWVPWIAIEYYKPLTDKIVKSTLDKAIINNNKFRDWRFDLSGNIFVNHSCGISFKGKATYSKFNANNFVLDKNAKLLTIQDITVVNDTTLVVNSTSSAYLGDFEERDVASLKMEGALMFLNNSFGISGGYEKYLDYDIENWKFGIPFSLKDKDDKPTVNFEVVWREISKTHIVGINAVYSFGKFLK